MHKQAQLKLVVMGAGNIGLRHIRILQDLPGAQLVAVLEPKAGGEKELAGLWPGPVFASFAEFAASGLSADVLSVCTPNHLHCEHTLTALAAGMHVVCEKPLALSAAQGQAMLAAAAQAKRQLFCMQQLVLGPVLQWVRKQLAEGQLGAVRQVQLSARWNRDAGYYVPGHWRGKLACDGGPLFTQFSHFIHVLYWLFGDFDITGAQFENRRQPVMTEFEDSGQVTFRFKSGAAGQLHYTTAADRSAVGSELAVVTEKGGFRISGQYLQDLSSWELPGAPAPPLPVLSPVALQEEFFREALAAIHRGEAGGNASAREGLQVVALIRQIYAFRLPAF